MAKKYIYLPDYSTAHVKGRREKGVRWVAKCTRYCAMIVERNKNRIE